MPGFQTHTDFKNGYRLKYPADWLPQPLTPDLLGFYAPQESPSDMFRENVNVGVGERAASLEQYVDSQVAVMQANAGAVHLTRQSDTHVSGLPAKKLEFNTQMGPLMVNGRLQALPLQVMYICLVKGGKVYEITYTAEPRAFDKYLPQVQGMLDSMELS